MSSAPLVLQLQQGLSITETRMSSAQLIEQRKAIVDLVGRAQ